MEEDTKQKVVRDFIENRKRMLNEMNDDEKKAINEPPTMEKIMKVINSLGGVSEEDKEKLRKRISERSADGAGGFSSDFLRENVDALRKRPKENLISVSSDYEYYLFMVMIVLVLLVFGKTFS